MYMELYSLLTTILTVVAGGGWFINYRANKRKANGEAKQVEADAFKAMQDAYQQTITDVTNTLNEVRSERDHYKDDRNALRKENDEMRSRYQALEDKISQMELHYKRDIARLGRRIDVLNPFLCGVVGCMHRKKVDIEKDTVSDDIMNGEGA